MYNCFNKIIYFDELVSSNDYLINLYKKQNISDVLTVYVNHQVSGRGRMGKTWFSGGDDGLSFSFSIQLYPKLNPLDMHFLVAVSVCKLLNKYDVDAYIKFPNDIFVENNKIAGILVENISISKRKYLIIGIGLNVNNINYPANICNAISMFQLLNKHLNKKKIFELFILTFKELMIVYESSRIEIYNYYMAQLYGSTEYVPCIYESKKMLVKILKIMKQNKLIVIDNNGQVWQLSGSKVKFLLK